MANAYARPEFYLAGLDRPAETPRRQVLAGAVERLLTATGERERRRSAR